MVWAVSRAEDAPDAVRGMLVGGARRRSSARHEGLGLRLAAARDHAVRALPTLPELPRLVLLLHLAAAARPQPVSDLRRPVDGDHAGDVERVVDRGAVQRGVRLGHRHVAGLVGLRGEEQRSHLVLGRVATHVPGQLGGLRRVVAGGRGGRARCAARDVRHAGQWHRSNGRGSGETRGEWPFKIRTASEFPAPFIGGKKGTPCRSSEKQAYINTATWPLPGCGTRPRQRRTGLSSTEQGIATKPDRSA